MAAPLTKAYLFRGEARQAAGDFDGAIADYSRYRNLDSQDAGLWVLSGTAKIMKDDDDGAIADLSQALELDPKEVDAYFNRAVARERKDDREGAIADYTRGLELDPKNTQADRRRAWNKLFKGDMDGALNDYARIMEFDPKNADTYADRGYALEYQGQFEGALADYARAIELKPGESDYARLHRQFLLRRLNRPTGDFVQSVATWKDAWTKTIGQFAAESLSEADFLAAAAKGDEKTVAGQQCEAFYYAGLMHLVKGDPVGARDFLNKSIATGKKDYYEYLFAEAELARMDAAGK